MKTIAFFILTLALLTGCEGNRVDYILSVANQSETQLTIEVQIGNQLDTFKIKAGSEKVVFSEVCDDCEDVTKECLAGIESISIAAEDGRVLSYNPNNAIYWEREITQNNTGFIHRCTLEILDQQLY